MKRLQDLFIGVSYSNFGLIIGLGRLVHTGLYGAEGFKVICCLRFIVGHPRVARLESLQQTLRLSEVVGSLGWCRFLSIQDTLLTAAKHRGNCTFAFSR